jgi:beta-1,4-N-acetylglucosaminyltransferase
MHHMKIAEPVVFARLFTCRYRFKPSLEQDMRDASLIISHAGAGSILEGMRLGAFMVVVVNDALMHNHQQELAEELHAREHLLATVPSKLPELLLSLSERSPNLTPMPAADETAFPQFVAKELGILG